MKRLAFVLLLATWAAPAAAQVRAPASGTATAIGMTLFASFRPAARSHR